MMEEETKEKGYVDRNRRDTYEEQDTPSSRLMAARYLPRTKLARRLRDADRFLKGIKALRKKNKIHFERMHMI